MHIDPHRKVNENPWPEDAPKSFGQIRIVGIVMLGIFGTWLIFSFIPLLFQLPELIRYGYGLKDFFRSSSYWLSFAFCFLGGLFLLQRKPIGYIFAVGSVVFFLLMRGVTALYYFFTVGIGLKEIWSILTGISFPFTIHTFINFAVLIGLIYSLTRMNQLNFMESLGVNDQTRRTGFLLAAGLIAYGAFTLFFADLIFYSEFIQFQF
jgi:hypothetical protein